MSDYSKGKIYKIISNHLPDTAYIGSTVQPLSKRYGGHVANYRQHLKNNTYSKCSSYNIVCYPDSKIILIEYFKCESKSELLRREGEIIKMYQNNKDLEQPLNLRIAGQTAKQWRELHKDKLREKNKKWRDSHKDKTKDYNTVYYQQNKDQMTDQQKEYNNQQKQIKIICQHCGKESNKRNLTQHQKGKKCKSHQQREITHQINK